MRSRCQTIKEWRIKGLNLCKHADKVRQSQRDGHRERHSPHSLPRAEEYQSGIERDWVGRSLVQVFDASTHPIIPMFSSTYLGFNSITTVREFRKSNFPSLLIISLSNWLITKTRTSSASIPDWVRCPRNSVKCIWLSKLCKITTSRWCSK